MIVYHGTHNKSAYNISINGFLPKPPSRRVWFTESQGYAKRRAKTKAGRANARPIVLKCNLNLGALRKQLGSRRVVTQGTIVIINGPVPPTVILHDHTQYLPLTHEELAHWVNTILNVKSYKGVSPKNPGLERLAQWIKRRQDANPTGKISEEELLSLAQQWLPEFFENRQVDFERLKAIPRAASEEPPLDDAMQEIITREDEALDRLLSNKADQRVRGLKQLANIIPPDLFEWCALFMEDDDVNVRVASLESMLSCEDVDIEMVYDLTENSDKRLRGAAVSVMAKHDQDNAPDWFRYGLTDPDTHVRIQTARQLEWLDPPQHPEIFDLARFDPNPKIVECAQKLIEGKGFAKITW